MDRHVAEFLNRLGEHAQAQRDRIDPRQANSPQAAAKWLVDMFLQPSRSALDTVGLGLEGTAKVGEYAAGETALAASQAQLAAQRSGVLGMDPNDPHTAAANRAAQATVDQGWQHPLAALNAMRNSGDTPSAYLAGAAAMADDPSNLIPLPIGAKARAAEEASRVARRTAKFSDVPLLGPALPAGATDIVEELAQQTADPAEAAIQSALARLQQKPDIEDIFRRADRVKQLPDLNAETTGAQSALDQALATYKDVQAQKAAAVRDVKQPLQVSGRLPKGVKDSPEFLQQVEDAKTAVTALNPGGPQRGQTYAQYLQPYKGKLAAAAAERDNAVGAIRNSLLNDAPAPVTPEEAKLLSATPETLPEGDLRGELPGELNARYNPMPGGPEGVRPAAQRGLATPVGEELDPATGKAVLTDTDGWFKASFDPDKVPKDPVAREAATIANPVRAQDGSVPTQEPGYVGHMWDLIKTALGKNTNLPAGVNEPEQARSYLANLKDVGTTAIKGGLAEQGAANKRPFKKFSLRDFGSVWGGVNVETPKNALILDPVFTRLVLSNEGIKGRYTTQLEKSLGYRLAKGETDPIALLGPLGDFVDTFEAGLGDEATLRLAERAKKAQAAGKTEEATALAGEARSSLYRWVKGQVGSSGFDLEAQNAANLNDMNTLQQAAYGLVTQLASPTRAVTGLLTAPGNLLIPLRSKAFHIINNVTHTAARIAAFEDAFIPFIDNSFKDLLQRATAEGLDTTLLQGRGYVRAGEQRATEGFVSPKVVRQVLGDRYGTEWEAAVRMGFERGFENSKRVLGDYQLTGTTGKVEDFTRKFVPFMSWTWRAYPRVGKYVLQHPAVGLAVMHLYELDRKLAEQDGRPAYQVGSLPLNQDTPLVGLLANVFTPEQEAEVRVNPLALFSPVGGNLVGAGLDNQPEAENLYQQASNVLGMVGGSFNPYVQGGAYIVGADYKAPGNASRYSPIDQELGHVAGMEVPTIQGPLRGARKAVTSVLPAGAQPDNYDPVEAKAKELVFEQTGKTLEQLGADSPYAKEIATKTGIYRRAEDDLLKGGAIKAAVSPVSPVPLMVNTETKVAQREAGQPPYSYDDLQRAKDLGLVQVVKAMTAANDEFYRQHPAAGVNRDAPRARGTSASRDPRLEAFDADPVNAMLRERAPSAYARRLKEYKATLGIN